MLSENLRKKRIEKGLTQVELAKVFNVSKQTVSNWENDNRTPDAKTIEALADFYEVSVDNLLGRSSVDFIITDPNKKENYYLAECLSHTNDKYSNEDLENFYKYSQLSDSGKQIINMMIEELYNKKEK